MRKAFASTTESFQRYARDKLLSSIDALRAALDPIIGWLESKGFLFEDVRAFRFLPSCSSRLGMTGRLPSYSRLITFAKCIAAGLPGERSRT